MKQSILDHIETRLSWLNNNIAEGDSLRAENSMAEQMDSILRARLVDERDWINGLVKIIEEG